MRKIRKARGTSRPFLATFICINLLVQGGASQGREAPAPTAAPKAPVCSGVKVPQFEDVTSKSGITFRHTSDPEKRYIVESMSGGVLLIDYDRDGWLDIY